jgi:hypothetical protein
MLLLLMRTSVVAACLTAVLLQPGALLWAQDATTYRAGLKNLTIPPPASDLVEPGPDYRVILEPLAPTANRLVAAFVPRADLEALRSMHGAALTTYALVEVPRRAEFVDVGPDQFKEVADGVGNQFGASFSATMKDQQEEINRKLKALNSSSAELTLDKPVQLGTLFSKQDVRGYGMLMSVSLNGQSKKVAMGMTVLRIQSRLVFLYTYTEFKDESSVQWIRTTNEHWADSILQANKQ